FAVRHSASASWTTLATARMCRTSGGGGIFAEGNRRSSRTSQRLRHSHLRQGGCGWTAGGGQCRSGRPAMSLSAIVSRYITYKQSMGMRFHTEARTLKSFCKAMGDVGIAEVQPDKVQAFLAG